MSENNKVIDRKRFNRLEAVVLLDLYLFEKNNQLKRTETARIASKRLRALAKAYSMTISESFRSPAGLQNRIRSIGNLYEGVASASVPGTEVFQDVVNLYKNAYPTYLELLDKANRLLTQRGDEPVFSKSVVNGQNVREEKKTKLMSDTTNNKAFFVWLSKTTSPRAFEEMKNASNGIITMLVYKRVLTRSLFSITEVDQIETALTRVKSVFGKKKMRITAHNLLTAYVTYLKECVTESPDKIADSHIEAGTDWIRFDFENAQLFERTSPAYCSVDGTIINGNNWAKILVGIVEREIVKANPSIQVLYEKPLYLNRANRPFLIKERIEGLNCAKLSNAYWINVNWSIPKLMEIIKAFCLHCGYDKNQVVLYGVPKGNAYTKPDTNNSSFDMKAAETILRDASLKGVTIQELIDGVQPGAAILTTKNALDKNLNVIAMPDNRYLHVDSFVDLDEAEEKLGRILKTHFAQFGGYSNNQLLFGAASQELSMFLNDNDCENIDAVYDIARYLFEKKASEGKPYKFYSPHIFEVEPDYPMNLRGLMINLARNNGGILHTIDAKNYLQKTMLSYGGIGQLLQINSSNTFLMYDDDRYLLSEALGIDDAWCYRMHDQMDDLFRKANVAYVIPRDISTAWLSTLPVLPHALQWTHLLLQEVLDKYPTIGFKSISADLNQSYHTLAAAFVPIDSPLQSFPDVVTLFMQERHELPMRMSGEELRLELREAGMLEAGEMIYALPKALDDYRFAWTDENKTVYVRGNK